MPAVQSDGERDWSEEEKSEEKSVDFSYSPSIPPSSLGLTFRTQISDGSGMLKCEGSWDLHR